MCCVEHRGLSSLWHSIALQRKNTEICGATSRAFVHSRYLKEIIYKDYLCSSQNRAGFGGSCNNTGVKHKNCYDRAACWLASSNFWGHQKKLTAWNLPAQIDASRALCIAINFLSRRLKIIKRGGGGGADYESQQETAVCYVMGLSLPPLSQEAPTFCEKRCQVTAKLLLALYTRPWTYTAWNIETTTATSR